MPSAVIHADALSKRYRRGLQTDPGLRHAPAIGQSKSEMSELQSQFAEQVGTLRK